MRKYTNSDAWFPALGLAVGILFIAFIFGCSTIQPGNDPLIVRVEQLETTADAAFNVVVNLDNSNRPFFLTNALGFHSFAEWLRAPITIEITNTLPRGLAIIKQLDDSKIVYKASASQSNALISSISVLSSALTAAQAWITVASNSIPPIKTP